MTTENNISEMIENYIKEMGEKYKIQKENSEEFDRQRYNTNLQIIDTILNYTIQNPKQRFIQILWNLDVVNNADRYNEEPQITLKRINSRLQTMKEMKQKLDEKERNMCND